MSHTCHWPDCKVEVPPKLFMCKPHWFALPQGIRSAIWQEYRPGQERDKNPSKAYLAVVERAMKFAREYDQRKQPQKPAPICNAPVGDRGQRFEVRAIDGAGKKFTVGWCGTLDGVTRLRDAVALHPSWHSPSVIDRETGEIECTPTATS